MSVYATGNTSISNDFKLAIPKHFGTLIGPKKGYFATSGASVDSPEVRKIKKAACDFEAMLLAKWWSSMKESGLGGDDDSTDPGHDTLDEMGIQAMSSAVASRGRLGIGAMLVRSLLSNVQEESPAVSEGASFEK